MKKKSLTCFILLLFVFSAFSADIQLPKIRKSSSSDLFHAIEKRSLSRSFSKNKDVPMKVISEMLWAGLGIVKKFGHAKTIHELDAISGATPGERQSVPFGWGKSYLNLYLLTKKGSFKYNPKNHSLIKINDDNLLYDTGEGAENAFGAIVISGEYDRAVSGSMGKEAILIGAGGVTQNIYTAAQVNNVYTLSQISFNRSILQKKLKMSSSNDEKPIKTLQFGYVD